MTVTTTAEDRELLELAAKAAGLELAKWDETSGFLYLPFESLLLDGHYWNPLNNDGDALRLSVHLALTAIPAEADADAVACRSGGASPWVAVEPGGDKYAATRRAIVGAAAAIGRTMTKA